MDWLLNPYGISAAAFGVIYIGLIVGFIGALIVGVYKAFRGDDED